jgi:hypothetical protein
LVFVGDFGFVIMVVVVGEAVVSLSDIGGGAFLERNVVPGIALVVATAVPA